MAKLTREQVQTIIKIARKKNKRPDLRRADLSWVDLSHVDLSEAYLNQANLSRAYLNKADLSQANLIGANLSEANLSEANLTLTYLSWANLSQANLRQANLYQANLRRANLSEADLSGVDLREADLRRAYLLGADLSGVDVKRADLKRTDLSEANLSGTNLSGVDLRQANLNQANLNQANLSQANVSQANLIGVNLNQVNLIGADLSQADLREANLTGANLSRGHLSQVNLTQAVIGDTTFGSVDLRTVKGLDTVIHRGPSYIDIHTLHHSNGVISAAFLRGAGISDTFITYLSSLADEALQYDACFISYSNQDRTFAQKLHADLQREGIRCWLMPEDLKVGDEMSPAPIPSPSTWLHDRQLVILSEHSIVSNWIQAEVETALEQERESNQSLLFPIRLDSAVTGTNEVWAVNLRNNRMIDDFSSWEDHKAYEKAFRQLLSNLTRPKK